MVCLFFCQLNQKNMLSKNNILTYQSNGVVLFCTVCSVIPKIYFSVNLFQMKVILQGNPVRKNIYISIDKMLVLFSLY